MTHEESLRCQLRARAWDALAALPDWLSEGGSLAETVRSADGWWEATVTVRRVGAPEPPAAAVLSLAPVQRFLPGCWLTDLERAVVAILLEAGRRMTQPQLRDAAEGRLNTPVSEGMFKLTLARLTDAAVGVLDNDKAARPAGYRVTPAYREFLAWAEQARRACAAAAGAVA